MDLVKTNTIFDLITALFTSIHFNSFNITMKKNNKKTKQKNKNNNNKKTKKNNKNIKNKTKKKNKNKKTKKKTKKKNV